MRHPLTGNAFPDDALLIALLETPVTDVAIERLLVTLRRSLLQQAAREGAATNLAFHCALARQCFINEYVYPCLSEEIGEVDALRSRLEAALAEVEDFLRQRGPRETDKKPRTYE